MSSGDRVLIRAQASHSRRLAKNALMYAGESGHIEQIGRTYVGVRLDSTGKRRIFHREDVAPTNTDQP